MRFAHIPSLLAAALVAQVQAQPTEEPKAPAPTDLRQRLADRLAKPVIDPVLRAANRANGRDTTAPSPDGKPMATAAGKPKAAATLAKPKGGVQWGYTGEGAPQRWGELGPANRLCAIGTRQTPIDIRDTFKVELERIQFDYRPSGFAVIDNGHTVQVNVDPGNGLTVMGRRFELQHLQFHRPSEERINGRQYDMSAHLFHKDDQGRLAVVAVLLERGQDQPVVQAIWNSLPLEKHEALRASGPIDLNQLLPAERGYFTFMGSLTTPPCTEGVLWMVMRQPVPISAQQLTLFSKLYPMNARPIQAGSGRVIKESF